MFDHDSWWTRDRSPEFNSVIQMVADVESIKRTFKIDIQIYDNYDGSKWMEELEENISDTALCEVGLPGTHDSGTHTYATEYGASPDSDLTSTISDIFDKGL